MPVKLWHVVVWFVLALSCACLFSLCGCAHVPPTPMDASCAHACDVWAASKRAPAPVSKYGWGRCTCWAPVLKGEGSLVIFRIDGRAWVQE